MSRNIRARAIMVAPLLASGLLVSGCLSSPTYGTDKTSNEQLTSDLSGMFSLKKKKGPQEYKPRPELVKPVSATTELPPPQENIVTASTGVWPESPEQQRARIRADATANRDTPGYESEVINDVSRSAPSTKAPLGSSDHAADSGLLNSLSGKTEKKQAEEVKARIAASNQGSPTARRYLSEPPLEYRLPADTAAVGDPGEEELKKARRLKNEASKGGDKSWRDLVPWL